MQKQIQIIILFLAALCSQGFTKKIIVDQMENPILQIDTLPPDSRYEKIYEVSGCGKFKLEEFRSKTILDIYNRSNQDWFFQCLINRATANDTVAQQLLLEICDIVGDQVKYFDLNNARRIPIFLDETIFLSQKSNQWIPTLMKYAADDHCNTEESDGTFGTHFGFYVQNIIKDNLNDRIYANELIKLMNSLYSELSEKYKGYSILKEIHKPVLARLEQDFKDGKLNFEQENK